jgi:predicted metal-dependent phosphoesterase TrpH
VRSIKINFHVHTNFSYDGYNSFDAIYKKAKSIGLNAVAITDHDTFNGVIEFKKWLRVNKVNDFQIIPAEEVTCSDGTHIIGLFINNHISVASPIDVIKSIKDQNGLVFFPHPMRKDGIFNSEERDLALSGGGFFEIFNAKIDNGFNLEAQQQIKNYPLLTPLAGSDAHYNLDVLKCYCEIPFHESIEQSVRELAKQKKLRVMGKEKYGSQNYFPVYYKYKEFLRLPQFLRDLAKTIFPRWKNFKERNQVVHLKEIYSSL